MKKLALTLSLILIIMFIASCYYTETNNFSIAAGVGVDYDTSANGYILTTEIVDMSNLGADSEGGGELIQTNGKTISEAVNNILNISGKRVYFSHAKTLIIGEDAARHGLIPILDYFLRNDEPRLNLLVAIGYDCKASDLLGSKPVASAVLSYEIERQIKNDSDYSEIPSVKMYSLVNMLHDKNLSAVLPALYLTDMEGEPTVSTLGVAVFSEDKLAGFLDRRDSSLLMYIAEKIKNSFIVIEDVNPNENVTLRINNSKTKNDITMVNGKTNISVKITADAFIGEIAGSTDLERGEELLKLIDKTEKTMEEDTLALIKKMQEANLDIFGFISVCRSNYPGYWDYIDSTWKSVYNSANVEVVFDINVVSTGISDRTINSINNTD